MYNVIGPSVRAEVDRYGICGNLDLKAMKGSIAKKLLEAQRRQSGSPGLTLVKPLPASSVVVDWSEIREGKHYSVKDVAGMLHCSEDYVLKHIIKKGTPGCFKSGRAYRITQSGLDARLPVLGLAA